MQTQWFDVEIIRANRLITTMRVEARNKGEAIGKASKQYIDHTLSFRVFNVNKAHGAKGESN